MINKIKDKIKGNLQYHQQIGNCKGTFCITCEHLKDILKFVQELD